MENKVLLVLLVEGGTEREDSVRNGVYYYIFCQYFNLFRSNLEGRSRAFFKDFRVGGGHFLKRGLSVR